MYTIDKTVRLASGPEVEELGRARVKEAAHSGLLPEVPVKSAWAKSPILTAVFSDKLKAKLSSVFYAKERLKKELKLF